MVRRYHSGFCVDDLRSDMDVYVVKKSTRCLCKDAIFVDELLDL